MSNNWFNPNYPPPPLPGVSTNYNQQANNYTNWYNGSYPLPLQPQFPIPPPNFSQPPPQMYNPHYQYDYSSYYAQNYSTYTYGASSTPTDTSLNYAEELESYRNTKAHYERTHLEKGQKSFRERSKSQRSYSRERRNRDARYKYNYNKLVQLICIEEYCVYFHFREFSVYTLALIFMILYEEKLNSKKNVSDTIYSKNFK